MRATSLFNPCPRAFEPPPIVTRKSGPRQFRERLLALKASGLTHDEIGERLGMSKSAVGNWITYSQRSANQEIVSIAYHHFNIDPFSWPKKRH